jgi:hypothetical protein
VEKETSVMKYVCHSRAHFEGLKKIWGLSVLISPPYSTYYTLIMFTFDAIPLKNPNADFDFKSLALRDMVSNQPLISEEPDPVPASANIPCLSKNFHWEW